MAFSTGSRSFISSSQIKEIYKTEKSMQKVLKPILKQFLDVRFYYNIKNGDNVYEGKYIDLLNEISSTNSNIWYEVVLFLLLTGNAFCVYVHEEKTWQLVKTDTEVGKEGDYYKFFDDTSGKETVVPAYDVLHFKTPSIKSKFFGESEVVCALLNLMIDRYGYEFIQTFFSRGGILAGVIETPTEKSEKIKRFLASLRSVFSSRHNAHTDKILPFGAKWVGGTQKFSDIQLREILRDNVRDFAGLMGVPPVLFGDTDGVNYANSEAQIKVFYKQTILPLQGLICRSIENNPRFKTESRLFIDNSDIDVLSSFDSYVKQIPSLKNVLTVNEIRGLLGYHPLKEEESVKEDDIPSVAEIENKDVKKKFDFKNKTIESIFKNEIQTWIDIYSENINMTYRDLHNAITKRKNLFLGTLQTPLVNKAHEYYKEKLETASENSKKTIKKDFYQDVINGLNERAYLFLEGKVREDGDNRFLGYSETFTERAHAFVKNTMEKYPDMSRNDIATYLRSQFGEAYKNQANTIVNTEIGHAVSIADSKITDDISSYTKKASKKWDSSLDRFTRQSHRDVDGETVVWDKEKNPRETLKDMRFSNGLRFPRDSLYGTPEEVINCRCVVDYDIIEFDV